MCKYLDKAIELAVLKSKSGINGPFGAVIVKDDEVISEGWNQVVENNDPSAHAEIMAIRNACSRLGTFKLEGCKIYCSCEPCPMCFAAIYWAGISEVVFACTREDAALAGFDDAFIYDEIHQDISDRKVKFVCRKSSEAEKAFKLWSVNPGRVDY